MSTSVFRITNKALQLTKKLSLERIEIHSALKITNISKPQAPIYLTHLTHLTPFGNVAGTGVTSPTFAIRL